MELKHLRGRCVAAKSNLRRNRLRAALPYFELKIPPLHGKGTAYSPTCVVELPVARVPSTSTNRGGKRVHGVLTISRKLRMSHGGTLGEATASRSASW